MQDSRTVKPLQAHLPGDMTDESGHAFGRVWMFTPISLTVPNVGRMLPFKMLSKVDLPEPLPPMMPPIVRHVLQAELVEGLGQGFGTND